MHYVKPLICLCIGFFAYRFLYSQTEAARVEKYGFQAAWITTAFGIDWPKKITDPVVQKQELEKIFNTLHQKNCNAVFFQVRMRADLAFPSKYEPFHEYFTGVYGKAPSYDVVEYAVSLARKYGIECHAWFNTMILRGKNATKPSAGVPSLWEQHPEWIDKRARDNPDQPTAYLNPGIPEVRKHLIDVITDFVKRYDVDGIQLDDYLRYPTHDFPDDEEFKKYNPKNLKLEDWRRENINMFVSSLYDELMKIKPYLRFGVTPIGVYKRQDKEPAMESVTEVYQDSREWVKRGKCDYLAPQVYFYIGPTTAEDRSQKKYNPAFEKLVEDWGKNKNARHVLIGLGIYKPKVKAEWEEQVALCNKFGLDGVSFYPYDETINIPSLFSHKKLIPPMTWKKNQKPPVPTDIKLESNVSRLSWTKPKDVQWVNIYKKALSVQYPFIQNVYDNHVELKGVEKGDYIVTSVDRFGNESEFSAPIQIK